MNRLEMCLNIFSEMKKQLHIKQVAEILIARYPLHFQNDDVETLAQRIGQTIRNHIQSTKSKAKLTKVPNGRGGYLSGVYRVKQKRKKIIPEKLPQISTGYTGKAGEYGLLSELLFRGYNASIMTVDEGIDVIASNENKYFHIQVKTSNINQCGKFQFTIQSNSYKANNASTTFYVLITRRFISGLWRSDYIVLQSSDIARFIATEIIKDGKQYPLAIRYESGKCILNKNTDITYYLNNFEPLK